MTTPISLAGRMSTMRYYSIITHTGRVVMAAVLKMYLDEHGTKYTTMYHGPQQYQYNQLCDKNKLDDKDISYLNENLWNFYKGGIIRGKLKGLLIAISKRRNEVSHNDLGLTPKTLAEKLKAFGQILNEIMDLTRNMFCQRHRTTIDDLRRKVDQDFTDIFERVREKFDPFNQEDSKRYEDELRDFGIKCPEFIQNESIKVLKTLYSKQCRTRVLDWLSSSDNTDPSSVSVSLMVDIEKEFHLGRHPPKEIDQTEILAEKNPNGDKAEVAIISGEAGAGKTTLLRLILELWSKGETKNFNKFPKLSDYDILIYFQLRDRDCKSLDDYIERNLDDVVKHFGLGTVKSSLFNSRCLFLLDGYDEINNKSKKLLGEILKLSLKTNKIVVTTRPINTRSLTDKVDKRHNTRVNLILVGMTEKIVLQSITKLVNKHVRNEDESIQMIKKLTDAFHSMPPEMKKLTKTPLYNNLIIMLSIQTQDCKTFDTITKLYEEITKHKLKRLVENIGKQNKRKVHEFQELYCNRSLKNLLRGKLELKGEDIKFFKTECDRLELPFENVMSAFFNTKHKLSSMDPKPTFCYRHTTEQEFAAAYGVFYILKKHKADNHETKGNIILYYLKKEFPQEYDEGEEDEDKVEDEEDEDEEDEEEEDEDEDDEDKEDENKVEDKEDENKVEDKEDENKVEDKEDENKVEDKEDENKIENKEDENKVENMEDEYNVEDKEDENKVENMEDENKVEDKEDEAEEYKGTRLHNVLPFLAGILVNAKLDDERFMDCLIKLVKRKYSRGIDEFLHILSESIGSNNVIKAIVRRLLDEGGNCWEVNDGRYLSYLRPLLLKTQPKNLYLSIRENPTTFPDLKPAIEAISSHGIGLSLTLSHHFYSTSGYSDEYFEAAKTLEIFQGSLSSKMFPLIEDEPEMLYLRVEEKHLTQQLLQSAKNLSYLELRIPYEENTGDDHPLCPLLYHGNELNILINFKDFEGGGEGEGKSCARKLNQLWPRLPTREESPPPPKKPKLSLKESEGEELRYGRSDMISIYNSRFSKDDIEEFLNTLQMKKVWSICIRTTTDISEENIQHLQTLVEEKGCTSDLKIYEH